MESLTSKLLCAAAELGQTEQVCRRGWVTTVKMARANSLTVKQRR